MNWFADIVKKVSGNIRQYIKNQQSLKAEFKAIEKEAYVNEMKEIAAEKGRKKAKGTYKSPFISSLMKLVEPKPASKIQHTSNIKNPRDLF
jgi:hypothetical protein|tara:strand:+ start:500 stop:772 length:273 start_codon:yes stop_codon:yes gene_type:complete